MNSSRTKNDKKTIDRLEWRCLGENLVILDTSFLLECVRSGRDFFSQLERELGKVEYATPKSVVWELTSLAKKRSKKGKEAKLALNVMRRKEVRVIEVGKLEADKDILELASRFGGLVVTLDWDLVTKLRRVKIPIAYIKDGKVELEGLDKS